MNLSIISMCFKSLIITISSLFLANKFNIFDYVSIVPDGYKYEIAIATYITISEQIYCKIVESIYKKFTANIECIFYTDKHLKSLETTPQYTFNEDVAYINCSIKLKGSSNKLSKNYIVISFPEWIDLQNVNNSYGNVNNKNQYIINFSKLINSEEKFIEEATAEMKIGIIKMPIQDSCTLTISPNLKKEFGCKFSANKFVLKNKEV